MPAKRELSSPSSQAIRLFTLARFLALSCLPALSSQTLAAPTTEASPTLETLVVTGVVPGPGLWRVESGGRALWILGTVSPLTREMSWQALKVGEILDRADAVLSPPRAEAIVGAGDMLKMITLARSANAATKLPRRKTLADVLPPATYRRWSSMKQQYLPDDRKVERQRPVFASQALYNEAIVTEGMTRSNVVWNTVSMRASGLGVPVVDTRVQMPLQLDRARYKAGIRALAKSQLDDVSCFTATLENLPADLETMKQGANAWATGDLDRLLKMGHPTLSSACKALYDQAMGFQNKPDWDRAARTAWLAAADAALAEHDTTLAVMPMADLLGESGVLAEFEQRGYALFAPD